MTDRYFMAIVPADLAARLVPLFKKISPIIVQLFPRVKENVKYFQKKTDARTYIATCLVSYSLIGFVFGLGMFALMTNNEYEILESLLLGIIIGSLVTFAFVFLAIGHPISAAKEHAKQIDKYLLFALRDLLLQISGGQTLYDSMIMVSKAGYGAASEEFAQIVQKVNAGKSMEDMLHYKIKYTQSDFLKKTCWQLLNSLRAGADLKQGLNAIINEIQSKQKTQIQNYGRELGLWSLVYMMFSVAIPTIGITMMVILSAFLNTSNNPMSFIVFLCITFFVQIVLMVVVKMRRPVVQF